MLVKVPEMTPPKYPKCIGLSLLRVRQGVAVCGGGGEGRDGAPVLQDEGDHGEGGGAR
jgi:hypothetical protein